MSPMKQRLALLPATGQIVALAVLLQLRKIAGRRANAVDLRG
jgi:hypothetical protein